MKNHKNFQSAFTLIELLVVIAIIGGLSGVLLPNFMGARERARDAQRKSDVKQIQKALELYKQDQSPQQYPSDDTFASQVGLCWTSLGYGGGCTGNIYMNKVPGDPKTSGKYYYLRDGSDTLKYTLCACLENSADPDSKTGNCAASYQCSSGKMYVVTEP